MKKMKVIGRNFVKGLSRHPNIFLLGSSNYLFM